MWVHFIGICGTATGQIAVEFKRNGFLVTGSEKGLYPPMSDHVKANGINIELGYKPEHLKSKYYKQKYGNEWITQIAEFPDEVIYVGTKGNKNPEFVFAKDHKIPIKTYPSVLKERVISTGNSLVIAGTYGKTTITSMLAWIFQSNGIDSSYMFGGLSPNLKNGVRFNDKDTKLSIVEGDEYMISYADQRSKFFEYNPNYLVLTGAQWDHADMFKTKAEYLFNFKTLVDTLPEDGIVLYDERDENLVNDVIVDARCKVFPYSDFQKDYQNSGVDLKVIGKHNKRNALAAFAMAKILGKKYDLGEPSIINALNKYLGLRRRLEIKYRDEKHMVIDDFGSTPHKAKVAIDSIVEEFPDRKLFVVFEPNLGSRTDDILQEYKKTFGSENTQKVYLPRFSKVKGNFFSNQDLADYLNRRDINVLAENTDIALIDKLLQDSREGGIIMYMGSHGFRGMIEKTIENLK